MSVDLILATPTPGVLTLMAPIPVPAMMDSWEMDLLVKVYIQHTYNFTL